MSETATAYKLFRCLQCGFEYDEAIGWPDDGIEPGTRWDEIPEDWSCLIVVPPKSISKWWR